MAYIYINEYDMGKCFILHILEPGQDLELMGIKTWIDGLKTAS
jgi:hypothetical protein